MSHLFLSIDVDDTEVETGAPAPERLVSGSPSFKTWNLEESPGGLYAGVWESTPGKWEVQYDEWEYCRMLSGVSVITEDGGEEKRVEAGDSFIIRPGFIGTWEVIETTRKEYVVQV